MNQFNIVVENPESTVVAEYQSTYRKENTFQSEAELEKAFVEQLQTLAYEYLPIKSEKDLIINLRKQLGLLNDSLFSDSEWEQFFKSKIANQNNGIEEKTAIIQEDHIQLLTRDDGAIKNIYLLDKTNIHNNRLQVINQYTVDGGQHSNRYDVTILVNRLPLVHVELKKRGVDIKEAFNQINRYNRESFWAGCGLFEYIQLFVISNGTYTKYYSNTTRFSHIKELGDGTVKKGKRTSNSFEFTSWWADANNRPITDLMDFGCTFFAKHTLLNILIKYCVFTSEKILLVMRPYQIVATERILGKINASNNYKKYGTIEGGGYIWHTTGSGKTLTSFKTAQLASRLPFIDKILFVVDRKDLDYQTMKEYDKFEKDAANSNTNTAVLKKQLEDTNSRIIVTTIQKLSVLIKKYKKHASYNQRVVIIFDECHRSQFGDMHTAITSTFKKYHLFGFTGTPIFAKNSSSNSKANLRTTEQAFGAKLHTYTIVDAITDKNVLPFRIDYISTMKEQEDIADAKVWDIDRERALAAPERISNIVGYIREHFDQKTKRNSFYQLKDRRLAGFNSIFAVASIDAAKKYYAEFQKQLAGLPSDKQLKVATIYSFSINEADDEDKDIRGYADLVDELQTNYPVGEQIVGEQNQKDFIKLYSAILKVKNILSTFDEFAGNEILTERDVQDYHSMYINLYNEFRGKTKGDSENVNDDIVFEMELIKQVEINIDYILALIKKFHDGHLQDKEVVISINKAIDSSVELRNKKDLIEHFIESLTPSSNVDEDWHSYVDAKKIEELDKIINEENLDKEEAYKFVNNAFRDGYVQTTGTSLTKVLPPVSRFTPTGERTKKRETVLEKLKAFFNRFWDISSGKFNND